MAQYTERKIMEVHPCLNAFELWVLTRPGPRVDVMTLQAGVESLRAELDTILEELVLESEAPFAEPAEDTVMTTLFATTDVPPPPP